MSEGERREDLATPRLLPHEAAFGVLLAGTSGAAILAYAFGPVPMSFTAPFVVLPTMALLLGLILLRRRLYRRLHLFADCLVLGGKWGLLATLAYDAVRPLLRLTFGFTFDPYRAMPMFGHFITGLPPTAPLALAIGWVYHFWNGISFGMMFGLLRPRGGPIAGLIWAMILQGFMIAAYPGILEAQPGDPGFLTMGLVGHGLWGLVLGAGLRLEGRYG